MLVQVINSSNDITFKQKTRYLDEQTMKRLKGLLPKINKQAVYVENGTNYRASFLKELQVDDFTLIDGRTLLKHVPEEEQLQKQTLIELNSSQLVIDNKTGKIIECNKPFLTPYQKVIDKVSHYIRFVADNFENQALVKRKRLQSNGLTHKGSVQKKKLDEDFAKLENEILKIHKQQ